LIFLVCITQLLHMGADRSNKRLRVRAQRGYCPRVKISESRYLRQYFCGLIIFRYYNISHIISSPQLSYSDHLGRFFKFIIILCIIFGFRYCSAVGLGVRPVPTFQHRPVGVHVGRTHRKRVVRYVLWQVRILYFILVFKYKNNIIFLTQITANFTCGVFA